VNLEPSPASTSDGHAPPSFGHHRPLDGLRGLAVAAVVLYHFAPELIPGGFLGVDVFFVLSGFLITSLLLVEFGADEAVSVRAFWTRRVRRLLPAALAVIIACVVLARFLEPATSRTALRTQSLASLFYVSNWSAILNGNSYESRFGHDLPLAHFWSLAVEEQFYILFPLVVLGIIAMLRLASSRRDGRHPGRTLRSMAGLLLTVAICGALVSAIAMHLLHTPNTDPSRVYFGSDTRVDALLIGVAIACLNLLLPVDRSRRPRRNAGAALLGNLAGAAALTLLIGAFVLAEFRQNWLYHGGLVAIAVLTAMMIWWVVRSPGHLLDRVLSHRWIVQLGLVSYGIYLWHWPARAFLTPSRTGLDGIALFALRVAATAIATVLSLVLIERPFRRRPEQPAGSPRPVISSRQALAGGGVILLTALLCFVLTVSRPVAGSSSVAAPPSAAEHGDTVDPIRVLLVGDSVAWTIGGGAMSFPQPTTYISPLDPDRITVWNRSYFGLSLIRWPKRHDGTETDDCPTCSPVIDWRASIDQFHPDLVVYSTTLWDTYDTKVDGRWLTFGGDAFDAAYLSALEDLRTTISTTDSRLVLMVQPRPGDYPSDWARQEQEDSTNFPQIGELVRRFAGQHPDVGLIDLDPVVCPDGDCIAVDAAGHRLRADGLHFTAEGAAFLAPFMEERLTRLASTEPSDHGPAPTE
jgi:peptidoglycan/LPS O-acetylase OafA/YrhL